MWSTNEFRRLPDRFGSTKLVRKQCETVNMKVKIRKETELTTQTLFLIVVQLPKFWLNKQVK